MESNKWVKSTRSGNDGNCVEVRYRGTEIDVRDSKNPSGTVVTFTLAEWQAFVEGVQLGEFNL